MFPANAKAGSDRWATDLFRVRVSRDGLRESSKGTPAAPQSSSVRGSFGVAERADGDGSVGPGDNRALR